MNTYARHLRAYSLTLASAVLVAVAFNATPAAQAMDDLAGWEILPSTCTTATACTPNHPSR